MGRHGVLRLIAAVAVIMAMVLTACGNDDRDPPAAQPTQQETAGDEDLELYCSLAQKLARAGSKFLERELGKKATPEDVRKARAEFVSTHESLIAEYLEAAPLEIGADLEILIASLKEDAGPGPDVGEKRTQSADKKIQQFEKENC
jgi:hypothetical protein